MGKVLGIRLDDWIRLLVKYLGITLENVLEKSRENLLETQWDDLTRRG